MDKQHIEPFGYFKATPFGWEDCAETDEGAVKLYDQAVIDELVKQRDDLQLWRFRNELNAKIGAAIQYACMALPEGVDIHIELERHSGTVKLCLPDVDEDDLGDDDFADQIYNAVNIARASVKEGDQPLSSGE